VKHGALRLFKHLPHHTYICATSSPKSKPDPSKIQYNGPTFYLPPTSPERLYPAGVLVENTLWVWAISMWRVATKVTEFFLRCGNGHLPPGVPLIFRVEEVHGPRGVGVRALLAHFTNPFNAFRLLGQEF
jgi:hypothetical protein